MRPWPLSTYTEVSTWWWGLLLPRGSYILVNTPCMETLR